MRQRIAAVGGVFLFFAASGAARADEPAASPPAPPATPAAAPDAAPTAPPTAAPDAAPPSPTAPTPEPPAVIDAEEATRSTAREIAQEGLALFDAGRHTDALDRFERAATLVRAPTMGLMAARSLEKLGRLLEAERRYLAVTRMTLAADASEAFRAAQQTAAQERAALLPRIPAVTLVLVPATPSASVTLDGKPLAASRLGAAIPLDPGPHVLTATSGSITRTERVLLREREARRVELSVAPPPSPGPSALTIASWSGIALGTAGIVLGAVTGGLAVGAKSRLDAGGCENGLCPDSRAADVRDYNTLVIASNIGLVSGITFAGAGLLGVALPAFLSKPSAAAGRSADVAWRPWIGPATAGATVTF
jgi:hypothetical protein